MSELSDLSDMEVSKNIKSHVYENILVPAAKVSPKRFIENADNLVHLVSHSLINGHIEVLEVMTMCGADYYEAGHITNDTSIVTCARCIRDYTEMSEMLHRREEREVRTMMKQQAREAAVRPGKREIKHGVG